MLSHQTVSSVLQCYTITCSMMQLRQAKCQMIADVVFLQLWLRCNGCMTCFRRRACTGFLYEKCQTISKFSLPPVPELQLQLLHRHMGAMGPFAQAESSSALLASAHPTIERIPEERFQTGGNLLLPRAVQSFS
jgi:hypothetical protein